MPENVLGYDTVKECRDCDRFPPGQFPACKVLRHINEACTVDADSPQLDRQSYVQSP